MIIRKSGAKSRMPRFGCSGDQTDFPPEAFNSLLYYLPSTIYRPLSAPPAQSEILARVAIWATSRIVEGFKWHNSCYELTQSNWKNVLEFARPDYLLVESCIHDTVAVPGLSSVMAFLMRKKCKLLPIAQKNLEYQPFFGIPLERKCFHILWKE